MCSQLSTSTSRSIDGPATSAKFAFSLRGISELTGGAIYVSDNGKRTITAFKSLMASPNSPTRGHPKFPQAAQSDYDVSGRMAKRAAASLSL